MTRPDDGSRIRVISRRHRTASRHQSGPRCGGPVKPSRTIRARRRHGDQVQIRNRHGDVRAVHVAHHVPAAGGQLFQSNTIIMLSGYRQTLCRNVAFVVCRRDPCPRRRRFSRDRTKMIGVTMILPVGFF